jgi:hypothetical protein
VRPNRHRFTIRRLMVAVAITSALIVIGAGRQTSNFSCHLCHNRKIVDTSSACFLPIIWHESQTTHFPVASGHIHQWTTYSRRTELLFLKQVSHACRLNIYEDGSNAPDRRQ